MSKILTVPRYERNINYDYLDSYMCTFNSDTAVRIDNDEINKWIKECIERIEDNPKSEYTSTGSGDTLVMVFRDEDFRYKVLITHNYTEIGVD